MQTGAAVLFLLALSTAIFAADEKPTTRSGRLKEWAHDKALTSSQYLYDGITTLGVGFVVRRPRDGEAEALAEKRWDKSWWQKEEPFRFRHLPRYLWPYQWPSRIIGKVTTGRQTLLTPGIGAADTINRAGCSRISRAVVGPFVLTKPAELVVKLTPVVAGGIGITQGIGYLAMQDRERQTQVHQAPFLDKEIENNTLLKPLRQALKRNEISREDARRKARLLLEESEEYARRVHEVWPDGKDPVEEEAFLLWSLNLLAFNELAQLYESREIQVDEGKFLYAADFDPVVDGEKMYQLIYQRHKFLLRLRGAETLLSEVTQEAPNVKADLAGKELMKSKAVQGVVAKLKEGSLDKDSARKWVHTYLDWEHELNQGAILRFVKKARENGQYVDRPLRIEEIEDEILNAITPKN